MEMNQMVKISDNQRQEIINDWKEKQEKIRKEEDKQEREEEKLRVAIRKEIIREELDVLKEEATVEFGEPIKYAKPVSSILVVFKPGTGEEVLKCKEISSEEIEVTDAKWKGKPKWERTLYFGVPPKPSHEANRFPMMLIKPYRACRKHYAIEGFPFTFNPRTGMIFSNKRKRELLIQRGAGAFIEIEGKQLVVLLDQIIQEPYLKDTLLKTDFEDWLAKQQYEEKEGKKGKAREMSIEALQEFVEQFPEMKIVELPAVHEYDVSEIVMAKAEVGQLIKHKLHIDWIKSMRKAHKEKEDFWVYMACLASIVIIIALVLYFADQGAFARY